MAAKRFLPLFGAMIATPALTAAAQPAAAYASSAPLPADSRPQTDVDDAAGLLKAELLNLAPAQKLAIAGDRLTRSADARPGIALSVAVGDGAAQTRSAAPTAPGQCPKQVKRGPAAAGGRSGTAVLTVQCNRAAVAGRTGPPTGTGCPTTHTRLTVRGSGAGHDRHHVSTGASCTPVKGAGVGRVRTVETTTAAPK